MGSSFKNFMVERQVSLIEQKTQLREEVSTQVSSQKGIFNNHYRMGSQAFFDFISEAKAMYAEGLLEVEDGDKQILESDIGEWAEYNDMHVPLDLPMVVVEDPREHDFRGGKRERAAILNDVIVPAYTTAKQNMQDAQEAGDDQDAKYFRHAMALYRQMGDAVKGDAPYGKLIKLFREMPDDYRTDIEFYLKSLKGPDAHDIRRKFFTSTELGEEASSKSDVELNKPKRGGPKKYYVYVKNDKGNVIKVNFGDSGDLKSKINDPEARKNFASRHDCANKKDKTKAGYWSCNLPRYADQLGLSGGGNFYW